MQLKEIQAGNILSCSQPNRQIPCTYCRRPGRTTMLIHARTHSNTNVCEDRGLKEPFIQPDDHASRKSAWFGDKETRPDWNGRENSKKARLFHSWWVPNHLSREIHPALDHRLRDKWSPCRPNREMQSWLLHLHATQEHISGVQALPKSCSKSYFSHQHQPIWNCTWNRS